MTLIVNGTSGITFPGGQVSNGIVLAGVQASVAGTSIDFNSIPAGVRRLTLLLGGVSTSGTSPVMVQIGPTGGVETSGYIGGGWDGATAVASASTGFSDGTASAASVREQIYQLLLLDPATNAWMCTMTGGFATAGVRNYAYRKVLAGVLGRLRVTTVGGADTFDAGSINLHYE